MSRCFVSYRRVSPDRELAHALGASLTRSGHTVFLDTKLEVGSRWVDEIEREIKAAEFFAVLLSEQSVRSDMVRQEVALAHQLSMEKKLGILPVRVAYTGALPYDLAAYLNPFQHSAWQAGEPFDSVCAEIEAAISHRSSPASQNATAAAIRFEPEGLDRVTQDLAVFVGPVARVLVNRAAKGAYNWRQLNDALAAEISDSEERKRFLASPYFSRQIGKKPSNVA
jgi:hypothetical protein